MRLFWGNNTQQEKVYVHMLADTSASSVGTWHGV